MTTFGFWIPHYNYDGKGLDILHWLCYKNRMRKILTTSTLILLGMLIGSLGMFFYLLDEMRPIRDLSDCLMEKMVFYDGMPYLSTSNLSTCYSKFIIK